MENKKQLNLIDIPRLLEETILPFIEKKFNESSEAIKDEMKKENNPLLNPEQAFEAKKAQVKEQVITAFNEMPRLEEGIKIFDKNRERFLSSEELTQLDQEMAALTERFPNIDFPKNMKDKTFQEVLNISPFALFCFYKVAYGLCEEKRYAEASNIFLFLTFINPLVKDHWIGYGICEREKQGVEIGLQAFLIAASLAVKEPDPHLFAADCYVRLKDRASAEAELAIAKELVKSHEQRETLQTVIDTLQKNINLINK